MKQRLLGILFTVFTLTSCMEWEYGPTEDFDAAGSGLFICNEGNFQYSNATLSYYDPTTDQVQNEVFFRANGYRLGDVAQSMSVYGGNGWIVVNNSNVIFAIDLTTFKEIGRIENIHQARYIHFISPTKAYVTTLWDNRIFIVNPSTYEITGYITVPGMTMESGSTEQMVSYDGYVYCTCWSYQDRILKIDPSTDCIVDELSVGLQPQSIVADRNGRLWTITDGGYDGSPTGHESPQLICIDAASMKVERRYSFKIGDTPRALQISGGGDYLYWLNDDVWCMDVNATHLPARPLVESYGTIFYGLAVDPACGDIYVADAIDYQQQGIVYRFSSSGRLITQFYTGINPGAFCWK